jgi:glycosyltransferase involved in cell wall biosynthesis
VRVGISLLTQDRRQFTGTGTYVRELIRELGRRPQDELALEVLCNEHAAERLHGWAPPAVELKLARGYRAGSRRATRLLAMARATARPGPLAAQFSPRVELVHYPLTSNVPPMVLPTVTTLHDVQHHELPQLFSPQQRLWRRFVYDRAAQRSTIVITDSDHARSRIIELLGLRPERVRTVHLAVDHERFLPQAHPDDEPRTRALGLPERFLVYPASLWPHKNHERLLRALALTADKSLTLVLTGADLGRLGTLQTLATRLGVRDRIRHLGFVCDDLLPTLYRRATALVFPSLYEGFGTPPLEAMACGCPVASSLAAALAEVCGDAAEPLDPYSPEQMAQAIDRIAGDSGRRSTLRGRGLAQAQRFSWSATASGHVDAYAAARQHGA